MCESCISIYQALKDVERPCRRSGCKGTWLDKRGGQLARAVRGKTGDPYPQYCENCAKEIDDLEDRQLPCKTENCTGTWTWAKAAQLAAGVRPTRHDDHGHDHDDGPAVVVTGAGDAAGAVPPVVVIGGESAETVAVPPAMAGAESQPAAARRGPGGQAGQAGRPSNNKKNKRKRRREVRPPERRCQACTDFLKDKKTVEIPCKTCATPIYWPPESQLQTHLGAWAAPGICGACKRDATEAARAIERETLRQTGGGLVPMAEPAPEPADAAAEPTPVDATPAVDIN